MKNSRLMLRICEEDKNNFTAYCKSIGSTPSDELRRYIQFKIKEIKIASKTKNA